ncbi:Crp/Fnr family transcriptional regulator [Anopheles sinensis]|uniref:Crp/Fnr family transcriptional regulator n=1 Tax=Anopheles sinensis TaxID=74873 RepID=A0A084VSU1_ANOSI|nr:Crp/Fnr family transcriptional regulator [Anopheles sinensis]
MAGANANVNRASRQKANANREPITARDGVGARSSVPRCSRPIRTIGQHATGGTDCIMQITRTTPPASGNPFSNRRLHKERTTAKFLETSDVRTSQVEVEGGVAP